ncbi:MAG: hypothetical protein ACTHLY_19295 [Pseudolabrys sp.]
MLDPATGIVADQHTLTVLRFDDFRFEQSRHESVFKRMDAGSRQENAKN